MAGATSYQRGLRYYRDGQVSALEGSGEVIRAVVSGSANYRVTLTVGDSPFEHSCDCPLGPRRRVLQALRGRRALLAAWSAEVREGE